MREKILGFHVLVMFLLVGCISSSSIKVNKRKERIVEEKKYKEYYTYIMTDDGELKDGLSSSTSLGLIEQGYYSLGKREGFWYALNSRFPKILRCDFYSKGNLERTDFFNHLFEKISSCTFKDKQPFNGKIWEIALGLKGIKFCQIDLYKNGKRISSIECDLNGYEVIKKKKLTFKSSVAYKNDKPFSGAVVTYNKNYEVETKRYFKNGKPISEILTFKNYSKWDDKGAMHYFRADTGSDQKIRR